jgi:hypothetical protein
MAIVLKDRVKQSASAPGTGTITLGSVATGFQGFSAIGNGNVTYFAIVDAASGAWEVNYGTYTSSGTTLSRNATPLSSSAAGALVNFTGTVDVFCTYPSEKAIYEETTGNVLIDGGPITVIGNNVTTYTTFDAALGEMYANVNSFAQFYAQNLSDGASASTDIVAYNDEGDGTNNFIDMGISSSNYTEVAYPIFTPSSGYLYNDGGELFIGSATDDVVFFAGGVDTTDEAVRINKTTLAVTTTAGLAVGGTLGVTGAATFSSTVALSADPTTNLQAATKQYVDTQAAQGFTVHASVVLATTTALSNSPTYAAGVYTATTNGKLTIDGVDATNGQRVLIKDEALAQYNGVYDVTSAGSAISLYQLTRSSDMNTVGTGEVANNAYFFVTGGTAGSNKYTAWVLAQTAAITLGVTPLPFDLFSSQLAYTGGTNIDVTGTVISLTGTVAATNGGTGTATVTTGDLLYGSATNTWSKLAAGAGYKSLTMNAGGTLPEWNAVALDQSGAVSGSLGATNGGTGLSSYTLGDIVYSSAANTLAKLAGNTTTTKKYLVQTGTGAVSAAPSWGTVDGADVTGNISGSAGSVANALALGTYLTGTSFNGSAAVTATVDATSANTASKVVARDASGDFSAGTITATLSGNATNVSGTVAFANGGTGETTRQAAMDALAGAVTSGQYLRGNGSDVVMSTIQAGDVPTLNQNTTGNATTATTATNLAGGSAGTVPYQSAAGTTAMLAAGTSGQLLQSNGAAAPTWVAAPVANNGTLTMAVSGTGLSGSASFTANQSGNSTFTVTSNATNANTGSTIVARDASGNFSAGTITATLSGNASTATSATSATTATTATTANATNTSNNFQMNSLGVGTAGSGTAGEIRATNNVTAYYSDDRLKTRLGSIESALDKVKTLDTFYYEANETAQALGYEAIREVGISAQQVQAVMPETVAPAPIDDKYLTVRYERLVPLLLAAIKELEAKVAALEAKG